MNDNKGIWYAIGSGVAYVLAYFGISWPIMILLCIAFVLDLALEIVKAAYIYDYKRKSFLLELLIKIFVLVLILAFSLLIKELGFYQDFLTYTFLMCLVVHDFIAASASLYTLKTGKVLPEIDIVSLIIKSIHSRLYKVFKKLFYEEDNN
jgi:hypothetical protein